MYRLNIKIKELHNLRELTNFIRNQKIKLVLFGEYHGFVNQIDVQKAIIKKVKPYFFLYEMLEEKKILNDREANKFLSTPDKDDFSVVSNYSQLKPIIRLCRRFGLPIIGCDIKNMCIKDKNWSKMSHKERIATFSNEEGERMENKRELRQAKVINEYTSKGLVFAVLGTYHARRNSLVLSKLREKQAIVIRPAFKWKERFNHKEKFKDSEISYIVKLINKVS